ncbi:MAG: FAD-dependent oxidoreductase [Lachnospiraceae bacterium]|jgi:2,4-dienoyl-CoA reductase-like NADH-dependent reductase (Old Yellow Enzyme family)/thioredoxin reductase|nr:FAD-dependent oxidoreductase [Lachnospiraceae bacterium]
MEDKICCGIQKYPHLFAPLRIGSVRLKNRILSAPTSPAMVDTQGHFTPGMIAYLGEKAEGGASVVTYGESIVHSATGKSHNIQLQLDSDGVKQGLAEASRAIHNGGAIANIQLSHGGKYGGLVSVAGTRGKDHPAYGPCDEVTPQGIVHAMPVEMIEEIIASYGKAAKLVQDCGFDMLEVHAAHGWLFSQFLSPVMNRRNDEFGGNAENRARFLLRTLDEVRRAVGPRFPIEIRLSGDDLADNGMTMEQCIEVAQMVEDKVDLINVSCGNHEDPAMFCRTHPSSFYPHGVNVYLAAEVKKHVKKPVSCVGSLNDPAQMEEILASGQADCVELGRALLADPQLPSKTFAGRAEEITPCIRCYECFGETIKTETIRCTVNPVMGQERAAAGGVRPAAVRKKVLVAGGGPGGMEAAVTAAQRGHEVTIVEKSSRLGGNLHPAGAAYFKQDITQLREVMEERVRKAGVKVVTDTEVTPEFVKAADADVLIVAIGSHELKPPIKGIDLPNVVMAVDAELHPEKLGHRVAIMGGGLVGSEAAVSFCHEGHEVTVIEMKPEAAAEVNPFYRGGLLAELDRSAQVLVSTKVLEIVPEGVRVEADGKESLVSADMVVCALGFRAPYAEVDALCAEAGESVIIGDCKNVGQIGGAISDGYYAALRI